MKTRISFYCENKSGAKWLGNVYDAESQPNLRNGDKFWYNIDMMYPKTLNKLREKYNEDFVQCCVKSYEEQQELRAQYKIVHTYREFVYNTNSKDNEPDYSMVIEYKVKKVKQIYWKFWNKYAFRQFFINLFKSKKK